MSGNLMVINSKSADRNKRDRYGSVLDRLAGDPKLASFEAPEPEVGRTVEEVDERVRSRTPAPKAGDPSGRSKGRTRPARKGSEPKVPKEANVEIRTLGGRTLKTIVVPMEGTEPSMAPVDEAIGPYLVRVGAPVPEKGVYSVCIGLTEDKASIARLTEMARPILSAIDRPAGTSQGASDAARRAVERVAKALRPPFLPPVSVRSGNRPPTMAVGFLGYHAYASERIGGAEVVQRCLLNGYLQGQWGPIVRAVCDPDTRTVTIGPVSIKNDRVRDSGFRYTVIYGVSLSVGRTTR